MIKRILDGYQMTERDRCALAVVITIDIVIGLACLFCLWLYWKL